MADEQRCSLELMCSPQTMPGAKPVRDVIEIDLDEAIEVRRRQQRTPLRDPVGRPVGSQILAFEDVVQTATKLVGPVARVAWTNPTTWAPQSTRQLASAERRDHGRFEPP